MAMEYLVHAANRPRFSFAEEMIPILENLVRVCTREGSKIEKPMNAMFVRRGPVNVLFGVFDRGVLWTAKVIGLGWAG